MSAEDDRTKDYLQKLEHDPDGYYLNNFYRWAIRLRIPDHELFGSIVPGFDADKQFRDFYPADVANKTGESLNSEKFWSMTPQDFEDAIEEAFRGAVGWEAIDRLLNET